MIMSRNSSKCSKLENKYLDRKSKDEERLEEKSGSLLFSKRDKVTKVPLKDVGSTHLQDLDNSGIQPQITNNKKVASNENSLERKMSKSDELEEAKKLKEVTQKPQGYERSSITESQNGGIHSSQDNLINSENKWTKIWMWHTWISEQPSGEKKTETIVSLMLYLLFFIIACIPIYLVMNYQNTFTSVEIVSNSFQPFPVPDVIVCPPVSECEFCPEPFQRYNFTHDVWWNAKLLHLLNISEYHLNLLASIVQRQAFSEQTVQVPTQLLPYIESARKIVENNAYYGPDYEFNPKMSNKNNHWNCRPNECMNLRNSTAYLYPMAGLSQKINMSSFNIHDLWYLIVKFPAFSYSAQLSDRQLVQNQTGIPKKFWARKHIKPKMTWINNSYCLLFKNDKGYSFRAGVVNPAEMFQFLNMERHDNGILAKFSFRYWMGNLSTQSVFLPNFQRIKNSYTVYLTFVKIEDTSSTKYTKCHNDILVLQNRHTLCKENILTEYGYTYINKISISLGYSGWTFYPEKVKLVRKQNVYSPLATFEIVGSIFCLFLGTSVYQIMLVLLGFMGKKWKFFKSATYKSFMCFLLLTLALILFYYDVNDHLQPKYTHQLAIGIGKHKIPPIFFTSTSYPNLLNYTKLLELNVSLSLLQYIHIAGTGEMLSHFYFSKRHLVVSKEERKKQLNIQSCDDSRLELHKEYKALAEKLGIDPTVPAYHLLGTISLDKCMLVEYCLINGVMHKDCCDKYFSYLPHRMVNTGEENSYGLVFESSENFLEEDLGVPEIEIKFNDEIWFNQNPFLNYVNYVGNFNFVDRRGNPKAIHPHIRAFVTEKVQITLKKAGKKNLIILSAALSEEEIEKLIENKECVKSSCYGKENMPFYGFYISALALYKFKVCGCYICHNNTEMRRNLEKQNKCCSPHRAIECLANPLLYPLANPDCSTTVSTCSNTLPVRNMNDSEYCEKALCSDVVVYKTNSTNCTEKVKLQCPCDSNIYNCERMFRLGCYSDNIFFIPPQPFIIPPWFTVKVLHQTYSNLDLNITKHDIQQYGCVVDSEELNLAPCYVMEYTFNTVYLEDPNQQQGQIAFKLKHKTSGNFILVNRSVKERSYNAIEILGLLMGAYSLLVGLDIVSIVAFMCRFMLLSGLPLRRRFFDSYVQVEVHWMRLFRRFISKPNNASPEDPVHDNSSSEQSIKTLTTYSKVCIISAVILLFIGLIATLFVGTSDLLSEKEFNLNIIEETNANDFPAFAVCKDFENTSSILAQIKFGFAGIGCWVNMKERDCTKVFDLQFFNGQQFCWVASDTSRFVYPDESYLSLMDFNFVFTINRTFPYMTWYGHLSEISSLPEINPKIASQAEASQSSNSDTIVHAYEVYKNLSCPLTQKKPFLCPNCTDQSFSTGQCCIYHQNVTSDFLEQKHQCPKVTYIEMKHSSHYTWLVGSDIWKEIEPYKIVALKRVHEYVTETSAMDRHSKAAKFALITGYCDLFLGISVLSIGGSFTLWFIRYIQSF